MKEYIERATVLNLLEKINPVDFGSMFDYEAHGAVQECLREISYGVEDIPAADVAEVRHGRWIENTFCSCCGGFDENDEGNIIQSFHDYCPYCGARMDKEAEQDAD
ncbi:hypothetical protein [Agathobaculum massiliense]|jgi:hypothetical protein|uniref:hypothetical protein n=1 Tax=Agathobaculum massiliense TaxID=3014267 RepID=UPI0036F32DDB